MIYVIFGVLLVVSFYVGTVVGIADCKRKFRIPHGVTDVYELTDNLYTYDKGTFEIMSTWIGDNHG